MIILITYKISSELKYVLLKLFHLKLTTICENKLLPQLISSEYSTVLIFFFQKSLKRGNANGDMVRIRIESTSSHLHTADVR